mmetsp:Transcript_16913/g.43069  ORF Transcript_16913/g.43069 Transcript_16913/m.43069 type:complete len:232 (-) Transcript_16913:1014-1709(-)
MLELLSVGKASPCVSAALPSCASRTASAFPDVHKLVHAFEIVIEQLAVVVLLLRVRRVVREGLYSLGEVGITDHFIALLLQDGHPICAHALTLHCLGAPKHLVRNLAIEQLAQRPLLHAALVHIVELERRIDGAICLSEHLNVEEGYSSLQAMCHAHAVRPLEVDIVQMPPDAQGLALHRLSRRAISEVEIACEEFISALTCDDNLRVGSGKASEEVVRDGGPDELRLVGL